jgi:hypothetical protein
MNPRSFLRKNSISKTPKVVGLARDAFGTRLSQRVICVKCQKTDHVPVRINADKDMFCRACAEKILKTFDQGRRIDEKKISRVCNQCNANFMVDESLALKRDILLCQDCYRGFDVWRGKAATKDKKRVVLTKIGAKTTFRKNIHDAV